MLQILYIVPSAGWGGAEAFVGHTAGFHDRENFSPVYCLLRKGPLQEELQKISGIKVYVYPFSFRLSHPLSFFKVIFWLRSIIREEKIDLVHSTMAYGALFGALAAWREKIPHLWFQHGPVSGWMDCLAHVLPAKGILVNSRYTLKAQSGFEKKYFFVPHRQMYLISLGVDFEKVPPLNAQKNPEFRVGIFGRLNSQKGIDLFIEALANLKNKKIKGFIFGGVPVVSRSSVQGDLQNKAHELQSPVTFIGETSEPLKKMSEMDAIVSASRTPEGFGLTLIEAMAVGRVPVAPREGGPLDIIEDGVNGLFFNPRDAQDLSDKILSLAQDPALCSKISKNALEHVRKNWDARNTVKALEEIYKLSILCGKLSTREDSEITI